jgi:hypothetical protein
MIKSDEIFAVSFFADDIRTEIDNKSTVVGIYHGDLILPEFPAIIARVSILTVILIPNAKKPISKIKFRLIMTNEEVIEHLVPEDLLLKMPREEDGRMRYEIATIISPFTIKKAGILMATVEVNGEIVPSGSIQAFLNEHSDAGTAVD